jgi:hypothetical protein
MIASNGRMTKKINPPRTVVSPRPALGYDTSGHMAPKYLRQLWELAHAVRTTDGDQAFVVSAYTDDILAEELAEAAVLNMTSGEDELTQRLDAEIDEERGGPFVQTSGNLEFASGIDQTNIPEATPDPFATPSGSSRR